jgi:hypothetical protein
VLIRFRISLASTLITFSLPAFTGCFPQPIYDQPHDVERHTYYMTEYGSRILLDEEFTGKYEGEGEGFYGNICAYLCDESHTFFAGPNPLTCQTRWNNVVPSGYDPDLRSLPGELPQTKTTQGTSVGNCPIVHAELFYLSPQGAPGLVGHSHIRSSSNPNLFGLPHELWVDYRIEDDPNLNNPAGQFFTKCAHGRDNIGVEIMGSLKIQNVLEIDGQYDRINAYGVFTSYGGLLPLVLGIDCLVEIGEVVFNRVEQFDYSCQ